MFPCAYIFPSSPPPSPHTHTHLRLTHVIAKAKSAKQSIQLECPALVALIYSSMEFEIFSSIDFHLIHILMLRHRIDGYRPLAGLVANGWQTWLSMTIQP